MLAHTYNLRYNPSTQGIETVEAGGLAIQGHHLPFSHFETLCQNLLIN